jgi:L-iditol 2-dehydrogenase
MHIGLAKVLGADKVFISEISEERLKLSKQFNADFYINPLKEDLKARLYEITDNIGPNVIIIAAPSKEAQESALDIAAKMGHINFFGGLPKNNSSITIDSNIVHYKQLYIHGTSGTTNENIKRCIELMSEKRMIGEKYISRIISLDEMPDIMNKIVNPNELKIVVKP